MNHNSIKRRPIYAEGNTVKDVVPNKPIEEKRFTMQDIDIIPAGAIVQWNTDKFPHPHGEKRRGALLWDGNKSRYERNVRRKYGEKTCRRKSEKIIQIRRCIHNSYLPQSLSRL